MHILQLTGENFKRLSVVQITPEGSMVQLTGENGAGKSSCLDAIWAALGGKDAVPDEPIRKGKKSARVEVKLGDEGSPPLYVVERTFTEGGGTYLKVLDGAAGFEHKKPQQILDGLLGAISYDLVEFMRLKAKEQFDVLRGIVKLDVDIDALNRQRQAVYDNRTTLNKMLEQHKAAAEAITVPELPDEEPDMKALTEKLAGISQHNENVRNTLNLRAALEREATGAQAEVEAAKRALASAEEFLARCASAWDRVKAEEIPELRDPASVTAEIEAARQIAKGFQLQERKIEAMTVVTGTERQVKAATDQIEAIDKQKQAALAKAKMPIEGLGFDDGVVLYKGVPLAQASSAEQLRISAAIGAALNPKLRVLLCRDGSLLDNKSRQMLAEFAEANKLQIWLERVDESGEVGVIIEDGHVKGQEELVAQHEKENPDVPATPAADDAQTQRAETVLTSSLGALAECVTVMAADKLNATVKTKLQKFPDMISKRWNPVYLERLKAIGAMKNKGAAS